MKGRFKPVSWQMVELFGALLTLAGFGKLLNDFLSRGFLPPPFVFDVGDTFMDWFNTAYWAHNPGAYSVWRTIYLPLSFVITGAFGNPRCYRSAPYDARDCDHIGIVVILLAYAACVAVSAIALMRCDRKTALYRLVPIALGGPLLFALERGNLVLIAYIPFVLLYGGLLRSEAAVAFASGFLVNMKVYFIFPLAAFAVKRRWRTLEQGILAGAAIYLVTMFIVGSGTPFELIGNLQNWFVFREGAIWDEILYTTTYKAFLLLDTRQYPIRDYIEADWVDLFKTFIQVELVASRAVALACIAGAWFYPRALSLNRIVFLVFMQSFIVQNPGGYALILILFLVFMERVDSVGTGIAVIFAYIAANVADFSVATLVEVERLSWLGGRIVSAPYSVPLGSIVRPGFILIILWALAIDSLIRLHRAARTGRPFAGLGPSEPMFAQGPVGAGS